MAEVDGDAELPVEVFGHVLRTIDGAMLTASTAKGNLQVGETAVNPALHMEIDQGIDAGEELENFSVALQEIDDGLVESRQVFVLGIASWIVGAAAVEDISAAIAGDIVGDAFL